MRTILSLLVLVALAGAAAYGYVKFYSTAGTASFRMAPVERGDMLPTIEATGTLEPEQVVNIGSQVNGLITDLKVDYGSMVEKGTVLALIDPTMYQATVDQNQAAVNSANANLMLGKANLVLAQSNLKRDEQLLKTKGAIAPNQYDTDFAACEVAKATVGVQEAVIKQAEAALRQSQINLGYCYIKSPVKGTIVDRRVNVGQDVVSSLSASSLFLLAKDLSRIQVWASVNEADIGRIHAGMQVHFKVDAYPNEIFQGEVSQIRLNATMTQNVVTYTVVVTTENKDLKLLPYMTASLNFEIDRHENVLKVPNAALRWKPRPKQIAADIRAETLAAMNRPKRADDNKDEAAGRADDSGSSTRNREPSPQGSPLAASAGTATGLNPEDWKARAGKIPPSERIAGKDGKPVEPAAAQGPQSARGHEPPGRPLSPQEAKAHKERHESGRLWIADGNFVRPVTVRIIATDGTMTEVRGKDVSEGMEVVVGENIVTEADSDATNPFMPKLLRPAPTNPKTPAVPSKRREKEVVMELIRLEDITKTYHLGEIDVPVLKGISLTIERGEMVALMGASGSGKTTLMNILGCLDRPSSGEYWLDGQEMSQFTPNQRAMVRTAKLGFVFQSFNLLPRTSAVQQVIMPLDYSLQRPHGAEAMRLANVLLDRVGLADRADHEPSQMSGGQQQRVAIARSLVNRPALLLADEPTGNLDSHTSVEILRMFQQLNAEGITVILVTHDPKVAAFAHRTIRLGDGLVEGDDRRQSVVSDMEHGTPAIPGHPVLGVDERPGGRGDAGKRGHGDTEKGRHGEAEISSPRVSASSRPRVLHPGPSEAAVAVAAAPAAVAAVRAPAEQVIVVQPAVEQAPARSLYGDAEKLPQSFSLPMLIPPTWRTALGALRRNKMRCGADGPGRDHRRGGRDRHD